MSKLFFILSIILFLNFSCQKDLKKFEELDTQKTTELIKQIIKDESNGYLSVNCILENKKAGALEEDFEEYLQKQLGIMDTLHLSLQVQLHDDFQITADLFPQKKIITQKKIDEIINNSKDGRTVFSNWLDTNCENEYCFIGKPIFNETFDLAYVEIGSYCGNLCGGGETRIYEYVNGKWVEKKSLSSWVS